MRKLLVISVIVLVFVAGCLTTNDITQSNTSSKNTTDVHYKQETILLTL